MASSSRTKRSVARSKDRSGVIDLDTHPRFKSSFPPVPIPRTLKIAALALGLATPDNLLPRYFTFSRRRDGTEIGLEQGPIWINLNCTVDVPPMRFKEAREWAQDFAAKHGFIFREKPRSA